MDIFKIFKVEDKKEEDCIKYIKDSLKDYFNIGENNEINDIKLIETNMLFQKEEKRINQKNNSNIDKIGNEEEGFAQSINEKNILGESNCNINTNNLNDNKYSNSDIIENEDNEHFHSLNETNALIESNYKINSNNNYIDDKKWETFKNQFAHNFNFLSELFLFASDNFNVKNQFEKNLSIKNENIINKGNLINMDGINASGNFNVQNKIEKNLSIKNENIINKGNLISMDDFNVSDNFNIQNKIEKNLSIKNENKTNKANSIKKDDNEDKNLLKKIKDIIYVNKRTKNENQIIFYFRI